MHYVKQLFEGAVEDWVHERFVRYGRGEFNGPILSVSAKAKGFKVSGSWDYASALVGLLASGGGEVDVKGCVFAKRDVSGVVSDFFLVSKEKKKKGLYSAEVSGEIDADGLKGLESMIPDAVLLFDADSGKGKVRSKKKPPKPGSRVDDNFATADFDSRVAGFLRDEFLFDVSGEFKDVSVSHRYVIEGIVPPDGVSDPARIRVEAKRKGRVDRTVTVDGRETKTSADLLV